jgi:hypothetical protein
VAYNVESDQIFSFDEGLTRDIDDHHSSKQELIRLASDQVTHDPNGWRATRNLGRLAAPSPRAYYGSCIYGAGLLIWGGMDSYPGASTESDFNLFDFGLACWVKVCIQEVVG